jgi:hypothetical protein
MSLSVMVAGIAQAFFAIYLIWFKGSIEHKRSEQERRFVAIEVRLKEGDESARKCDITLAANMVRITASENRFSEQRLDFNEKFNKIDSKLDKLADKIDAALEFDPHRRSRHES